MAIYKVQGPDGVQHELEGPEGATDEQILSVAQQTFGKAPDAALQPDAQGMAPTDATGHATGTLEQQIQFQRGTYPSREATEPEEMRVLKHVNELGMGTGAAQLGLGVAEAVPGMIANTKAAGGVRNALANWFEKKAAEQAAKAGGAGASAEEELGAEGVRNYGRMLQDKGIVAPYRSSETSEQIIGGLKDVAGKEVGKARDIGDLRSMAQGADRPTTLQIEQELRSRLGPKYNTGIASGEKGQVENAMEELRKLSPVEQSTTGEETVQGIKNHFGRPGTRPTYYEDVRAKDELARLGELTKSSEVEGAAAGGVQTGPQSYAPGAPISEVGGPIPVEGTPYLHDQPTFTELFDKSTAMNNAANQANKLQQPSGALTESANILSEKSTQGLENFLDPAEAAGYKVAKKDWGDLSTAENLMAGRTAKGFANSQSLPVSKFGALSRILNEVAPHSAIMGLDKKVEAILRTKPEAFGQYAKVLQDAVTRGGSALASTMFVLQQQDPQFQEMTREMNGDDR